VNIHPVTLAFGYAQFVLDRAILQQFELCHVHVKRILRPGPRGQKHQANEGKKKAPHET
jgi:hypothetical protein